LERKQYKQVLSKYKKNPSIGSYIFEFFDGGIKK
jgi:hypothetical protein